MFDNFSEGLFKFLTLQAYRSCFYRKCLWAKGFYLKTVLLKLFSDVREDNHLFRLQFHEQGHQQTLALEPLNLTVTQDLLKKHSLMCNMLVNDPQPVVTHSQNERVAHLAKGLQRAQVV